jgi:hypothetical protein
VEEPEPGAAIEVGVKLAVTPEGNPVADKETAELKPPDTLVLILVLPELPWTTDKLLGEAATEKSEVGLKMISSTACNSIPFGATPVCP